MSDIGTKKTEKEIKKVEKEIDKVYSEALSDINGKLDDFHAKFKVKEEIYLQKLSDGKITQEQYNNWVSGQVFQGEQWANKKNQILNTLTNSNKVAVNIVNGGMYGVFAFNSNYQAYEIEKGFGVDFGFGLYDTTTVKNLIKNDPQILPKWKINEKKDYIWNEKKLNNAITQGIIQGEGLDKIAKRISTGLCSQNENLMKIFARTGMTQAQNAGRYQRQMDAKKLGINMVKEWMSTLDGRTRDSHRHMDGEQIKVGDKWHPQKFSNGCRYPGDPEAPPRETYNCRCTLVADLVDYPSEYERYDNINGKPIKNMTYDEWEKVKRGNIRVTPSINTVVNSKDISATWQRRPDQFDFEIEDVINAQGFDGLPRVVSADEFDDLVKQANGGNGFIAQRTYSAPTQEILDDYRDQLYHGKWYVDCSTGGAQYGQGMYCAADYTGKITDGIRNEMAHYQKLGQTRATKIVDNEQIDKAVEVQWGRIKSDISFPYDNDGKILHSEEEVKEELRKAIGNLYGGEIEKLYGVAGNNKFAIENKFSYTETLTLDPSARIISHDDLIKLREESKSVLINEELEKVYTGDDLYMAKRVAGSMNDSERNEWSDFRSNNRDKWLEFEEKNESAIGTITDSAQIKYDKLRNMDIGSYATLKGYDAINAEGHGASGSYTVILNRTKVIFKRE